MSDVHERSDHAWAQESVAAYLAGGLSADEAVRLEAHTRDCPACAAALDAARRFDLGLNALFAGAQAGPDLEDRAVRKFREGPPRTWQMPTSRAARVLIAAGVLIALGGIGALAGSIPAGGLPLPGNLRAPRIDVAMTDIAAKRSAPALVAGEAQGVDTSESMSQSLKGEDAGLHSNKEASILDAKKQIALLDREREQALQDNLNGLMTDGTITRFRNGFLEAGVPSFGRIDVWSLDGTYTGDVQRGHSINDTTAMFALTQPMFDPTGTYKATLTYTPHYFKPGDLRPPTVTTVTPVVPVTGVQAPGPKVSEPKKDPDQKDPAAPNPEPARRIVIRSGDMEFEVDSFDTALETITRLIAEIKGAFVATVNSEKLPNGKVKGSVTVRTPPEALDALVLNLRKELGRGGELKGVKISSQDITKMYTDLESRLRASRTMETRLLQIIKEGKGEIKQLLEAERELGVWRTKIEELEGEIRYYSNLAALSTLTITLAEKEIRAAAGLTENERVQAGVEVEDVDKAYQQILTAVVEAKGRVSKSELKQLALGQFNASLQFEVAPESAGPIRDRLHQLGRVARLEIDRVQQADGTVPKDAKAKRGDTVFLVQLYNLVNVAPRETATVQVAVADVSAAYQSLRDAIARTTGRVIAAQLNEQDRQNVTAQVDVEVRRAEEAAVRAALDAAGEVVSRQVTRAPESDNVTDSKVLYKATLLSAARLRPRELTTLGIEVQDVDQTATVFTTMVTEAKGRQLGGQVNREPNGRVTARLIYEVPLGAAAGLAAQFKDGRTVRVQQTVRDPHGPEGKYATARLDVTLTSAEKIVPDDAGVWPQVKRGLSYSASVLLTSLTWVVFGLCVVLPWAVIGFGGYRAVRWVSRPANPTTTTPTT
jgi:hypothetical protein